MFLDLRFPWLTAVLLSVCASACTTNVVMRRAPAIDTGYLGVYQRCARDAECKDDPEYDSSKLSDSHTSFFRLPQCPYGIHELAVLDSGSNDAVVLVRCAAPDPARGNAELSLPVATSGGGTR